MTLLRNTALAAGLLLGASCAPDPPADPVAEVLALAPRPVYGRLIGAHGHAPCALEPGPDRILPLTVCLSPGVVEAGELPSWLRKPANADQRRAAALWHLAWSVTPEALDAAVLRLEDLTRRPGTTPAEVWNDLSVAYLERAFRRDRPLDLLAALAANQRISEPGPESLFNHALLLETLGFSRLARDAWQQYLRVEPEAQWVAEARKHLTALRLIERPAVPPSVDPLAAGLAEVRLMLREHQLQAARGAIERLWGQVAPSTSLEAELHLAVCEVEYQDNEYGAAMASVNAAERSLEELPEPALRARIWRWRGLLQAIAGQHFAALDAYEEARRLFRQTGDAAGDLNTCRAQADTLRLMGDVEATWRVLLPCLRSDAPQSARSEYGLLEIAYSALPAELRARVGEVVLQEMLRLAEEVANPVYSSSALIARVQGSLDADDLLTARRAVGQARETIATITDPGVRRTKEGDLLLVEAAVLAVTDPEAALAAFDSALMLVEETDYDVVAPTTLAAQSVLLRRLGRPEEARRNLDEAIVRLDAVARDKPPSDIHVAFAEQVREVYSRRLELGLELGEDPEKLLAVAERGHLVLLRRSAGSKWLHPPSGTSVVAYFVLPQSLLIWHLDAHGIELRQEPITAVDLGQQVDDWLATIKAGAPGAGDQAAVIGDLLLGDLADRLLRQKKVIFVPDGSLHRLPFAALRIGSPQRFLIEALEVGTTPAVSLSSAPRGQSGPMDSVLVVAANEPGAAMPRLPAALREGRAVQAVWRERATLLTGAQATSSQLLARAPDSHVLHIAAHAWGSSQAPFTASVVLAADPQDGTAQLPVTRFLEQSFPSTRLVVLSACGTAQGGSTAATGAVSLAGGFLMAGIPEAVATLWEVQDDQSAELASRLHEHLARGRSAASALRSVQVEALRRGAGDPGTLRHWAAYQHLQAGP
ncbi:MAG TPA: CHAT domain-containing protein [Thermoanaerobaculia bacterium]|nr:CHAT domain-containing protein [Thermoanaerobaculia bacterium]